MGTLSGKIAWITGTGSGIGHTGLEALAKAGAEMLDAVAGRIRAAGVSPERRRVRFPKDRV